MKKLAIALLLAGSMLAFSQDAPKPTAAKELTVPELKLQLAQKDVEIAQLKVQLIQLQAQAAYVQAQTDLAKAQKIVQDATPKPETKQ